MPSPAPFTLNKEALEWATTAAVALALTSSMCNIKSMNNKVHWGAAHLLGKPLFTDGPIQDIFNKR